MKGHAKEVTALCLEGGKLITGGKDGKIIIYSAKAGECKLEKTIELAESFARGIDYLNGKILVGLRSGSIYEINESSEEKKHIMASHHEGEAWGLELVPDSSALFTIGDDNKLLEFNFDKKEFVRKGVIAANPSKNAERLKKVTASTLSTYPANQQGRAIGYSKHHDHIAISNNMGKITIRKRDDLDKKIKSLREPEEWCEVIKYSPCGKYLAVGSHDNAIYVYDVANDYSLYYKCAKHNSFVTSLDWSVDSTYIRSVCGAYEKLYFNI